MEEIINYLSSGYDGRKQQYLKSLVQRPDGWEHSIISKIHDSPSEYEEFKKIFSDYLMTGNMCFINFGEHGSLNCGRGMDHYDEIKQIIHQLWNAIEEGTSFELVLKYLLLPVRSLPSKEEITAEDNPQGERFFSKMCLNLAVKLAVERMSFVKGFTKRGEQGH